MHNGTKACSIRTKTSLLEPVTKLSCLNNRGTAKLAKVCTLIHTFTNLVVPAKKLKCLYKIG